MASVSHLAYPVTPSTNTVFTLYNPLHSHLALPIRVYSPNLMSLSSPSPHPLPFPPSPKSHVALLSLSSSPSIPTAPVHSLHLPPISPFRPTHLHLPFSPAHRSFKLVKKTPALSLRAVFRGSVFAACRDTISQGVPFMLSSSVRERIFDPLLDASHDDDDDNSDSAASLAAHWGSVILTSVAATVASQGLHNAQITMQADQSLSYASAVKSLWRNNGMGMMVRGAEARIGLLLVVNILNELILKPAWAA